MELALRAGRMGTWQWDIATGKVYWSSTLEEIHGIEPGTFGGTFDDFKRDIHPDDKQRLTQALLAAIDEQTTYQLEYRIIRPDGTIAWLETRGNVYRDSDGVAESMIGVCADISSRKRAELDRASDREHLAALVNERTKALEASHQRLRQTERMAAMGTLAAGLGHDVGNLVFPLRIRLDLMMAKKLPPSLRSDLESVSTAVNYLQRLANGLRHMAMDPGEAGLGSETTDLHEWWTDVEPVLRNAVNNGIKLQGSLESELPQIAVAPHGLTQAVFHLIQNANEAMANYESGNVVVSAERGCKQSVKLIVSDDGPGMFDEVRQRCLEPFFTTKVRGISTGLGLTMVNGVISRAGGSLDLQSNAGGGTVWTLTLPTVDADQRAAGSAVVTVADKQRAAFLLTMLESLGVQVEKRIDDLPGDSPCYWITDESVCEQTLHTFVKENASRTAIVLGDPGIEHSRIVAVDPEHSPLALRQLLREQIG